MDEDIRDLAGSDGVSIHTGFPNPALERRGQETKLALDLNQLLVRRPSSTYLYKLAGHRWADQGIFDGDVAIIDRSLQAGSSDLIVAWRNEGSILCRQHQLMPSDKPWGVVTAIIHQFR